MKRFVIFSKPKNSQNWSWCAEFSTANFTEEERRNKAHELWLQYVKEFKLTMDYKVDVITESTETILDSTLVHW